VRGTPVAGYRRSRTERRRRAPAAARQGPPQGFRAGKRCEDLGINDDSVTLECKPG